MPGPYIVVTKYGALGEDTTDLRRYENPEDVVSVLEKIKGATVHLDYNNPHLSIRHCIVKCVIDDKGIITGYLPYRSLEQRRHILIQDYLLSRLPDDDLP